MDDTVGMTPKQIELLESNLESFTFDGIIDRLDYVFNKQWSFRLEGPHIIEVPSRVPKNKAAKNPRAFVMSSIPHWQCTCSISISSGDIMSDVTREYAVLVAANDDSSFAVARDLSLILAAYYGFGVGKKSNVVLEDIGINVPVKLEWGGLNEDTLKNTLHELESAKKALGIRSNQDLDPYVLDFSEGKLKSHSKITRSNLKDFTDYLKLKANVNDEQPHKS